MRAQAVVLGMLLALPLGGCAGVTDPSAPGPVVFEVESVNFAWVPTWRGFAIDSTGAIHGYDLKGTPWQPKNQDYPTRAELLAKFATNSTAAGQVAPATFAAMRERAGRAAAGPLSEPRHRCADAGTLSYTAWLYDAEQDAFRRVLLRQEGDIARLNQSSDAQVLVEWLKSLQLIPAMEGCQP